MFFIIFIISFESGIIWPSLFTIAMLSSILPHTFISIAFNLPLTRICFQILNKISSPMSPAFFPLTLQYISITLLESSVTLRQIIYPLTFITSSIGPDLFALAIFLITYPFTSIFSTSRLANGLLFRHSYK
jgi:hypothetical protein